MNIKAEREAFEEFALANGMEIERSKDEKIDDKARREYAYLDTGHCWVGWLAAKGLKGDAIRIR